MKKIFASALLIMLFTELTAAARPDAYLFTYLDKNKITIGDRVKLTIKLSYKNGVKLEQFVPEDNLKSFEVKNYKISKAARKYILFGNYTKKYEYTLSTFTTGVYDIQPFVLKFEQSDGTKGECRTNPLKIEVSSMLDRESAADIKDIKPPVNFRGAWLKYLMIILLLLAAIAGFIAWKNYLKKEEFYGSLPEDIDPYEYATSELEKLKGSELVKNGQVKEFYIRLTYIVRVYLSRIFSVNIMDMTTTEAVRALREKDADKKFLVTLREFFDSADLVKFAKYVPSEKDAYGSFDAASGIVEAVKPEKSAAPAAGTGK